MKWFKHISDSLDDPFIFDLISEFGGDGYLVFFGMLEVLARECDGDFTKLQPFSDKFLAKKFQLSVRKLSKILQFIKKNDRFLVEIEGKTILINCPKLRELQDDYSKKKRLKCPDTISTNYQLEVDKDKEVDIYKEKNTKKETSFVEPSGDLIFLAERVLGVATQLTTWLNDCKYPPDWIKEALIKTEGAKVRNPNYTKSILENYAKQGGPPNDSNAKARVQNNRSTDSSKSKFAGHPIYKQS